MFLHAKNGVLDLGDGRMDYIRFGSGRRILVMLPGLGDSLRSIRGMALPMALLYRAFARDFTVYSFSRKYPLRSGCSIRDLADDQIRAMDLLGIQRADMLGVSMGGMISQQLAAHYPDRIERLVLVVTAPKANALMIESVNEWMNCALRGDHTALMETNLRRIYSPRYCRRNGWLAPVLGRLTRPKSYDRFLLQSRACLGHDASTLLGRIRAKTLVIGGEKDMALGGDASRQLAEGIPGARLKMYPEGGHGLYDEEKDFKQAVLSFLLEN